MYNGWKNYETWNVALWIGNDYSLMSLAMECTSYSQFRKRVMEIKGGYTPTGTPDGVSWSDPSLDIPALTEMIRELNN